VVCPYCGTPKNKLDGICPNCGNEVDPNRLYANPIGVAWRGMRMLHRLPVKGEPGEGLVRTGLFVIGAVLFLPSFLGLIALITSGNSSIVSNLESLLFLGLGTLVGFILCFRALREGRKWRG
jgi:hypothetical protein